MRNALFVRERNCTNRRTSMAKRTASQRDADDKDEDEHAGPKRPRDFLAVLHETGAEKYGEILNFELCCTANKGRHLLVSCKMYHWHPPAGSISRKISGAGRQQLLFPSNVSLQRVWNTRKLRIFLEPVRYDGKC